MAEIALSLSGGGYRAAMFHLGTLSYLNHLKYEDGHTFLHDVKTISTISGGTITGLWYVMNVCRGNNVVESFRELATLLKEVDLPGNAIRNLVGGDEDICSLIRVMVSLYDDCFFHGETFKLILDSIDKIHIHHFSANGTDFDNGLPFHFQATKKIINARPEYSRGLIGNKFNVLDWRIAKQIRLSEILAVSSCFPGGFEPMCFPKDFSFSCKQENLLYVEKCKKINLMDGGIVDNQGIEPLILANTHLSYDHLEAHSNPEYPCLDLLIISDVASPYINSSDFFKSVSNSTISFHLIEKVVNWSLLLLLILLFVFINYSLIFWIGVSVALFFVTLFVKILLCYLTGKIKNLLKNAPFSVEWSMIRDISLHKISVMMVSRFNSLLNLASSVFMKPIRQMRYRSVYQNKMWKNRCVSNNLSELASDGCWNKKKNYPKYLIPSDSMKKNSDLAKALGTTLWFTEEDIQKGVPDALYCAGQYTICMNLLEYIDKLKKDNSNTNKEHCKILTLEDQLRKDWEAFKQNPNVFCDI